MFSVVVQTSMNSPSTRATPVFRLGVTVIGLLGLLVVALYTQTLGALLTAEGALAGLAVSIAVSLFAWRYPDEFVSTPRVELGALAFVLIVGVLFGLYAPEALVVAIWVLGWTLCGLAVLVVGRPKALARLVARIEAGR
jgi:hypothetical protein